ncbi:hypothetical protein KY285_007248 [Solanum tuberosum]|nr:hypothetical protein KY284_009072 [Solanum tuberosum]KAH0745591.1 hypothetical protein KY285_007248 [Solanum tuberosum]
MVDAEVIPTVTTVAMGVASPFYLHPSESAGSTLLPAIFDGTDYRSWRRVVLRALSVKSKTSFINGKLVKPTSTDPTFAHWERCDDMVTSWMLNSLSPDLRDGLQYVNNAKVFWEELEDRYDQTNGCKLYQIQKEINDLVQGNLDITGYFIKMKKLWEEMNTIVVTSQCSCVCTCGGKTKMYKAEQDRRLIHFLMGLNEVYTAVRGNTLMMVVLPTMAHVFAILCQEEKQREMKPHNSTVLDPTSLIASSSTHSGKGYKTNYNSSRGSASSSGSKFSKGKGLCSAANAFTSEEGNNQSEKNDELRRQVPVNLSYNQYEQLLNLLETLQVGNNDADCHDPGAPPSRNKAYSTPKGSYTSHIVIHCIQ